MEETATNSPGRLAVYLPGLYGGGAERTMLNLVQGIAERGYAVDLVLSRAVGPYLTEVPQSVRLIDLHASRALFSLPAFVRYLRSEQPVALLSALNYANLIALWARRMAGIPQRLVISEQNTFSVENQKSPYLYSRLMARLLKVFYPWAEGIVAVSKGVADDLAKVTGICPERIRVIFNPIVTPELRQKVQESIDHPWFQPGQPPVLLAVGRLTEQKDFSILIRAFNHVHRTQPARLLILGEGEERPALEALIRQLGLEDDVSLPGFVPNPYPYMAHASVFVLSSRWEGLPTVLVEALYCGVSLIATDCPSGPREILQNGQFGQLVPVGDVASLVIAIEDALRSRTLWPPRESWQPFELSNVIDQYVSFLLGI